MRLSKKDRHVLVRIVSTAALFLVLLVAEHTGQLERLPSVWLLRACYAVPYFLIGYDILWKSLKNVCHLRFFDEEQLMLYATVAAFCIGEYPEATAVMLLFQIGELFQRIAVGKSRKSISDLMDICPVVAYRETDGAIEEVDPEDLVPGDIIVVKAGERVPVDGVVVHGVASLDTAALTGESAPRDVAPGDALYSGCINLNGTLRVEVKKKFEDSTVAIILEMVENASDKKAKTEAFITRFAHVYTPAVIAAAALLALIPPLVLHGDWSEWIRRACIFLVISCPCALVISVPLSFFGGIGAASRAGVLVKGSNCLEAVAKMTTVVFDKTGTLTCGRFSVTDIRPADGDKTALLALAAAAEYYSDHPIAASIRAENQVDLTSFAIGSSETLTGQGVKTEVNDEMVWAGNEALMRSLGHTPQPVETGTAVHVATAARYLGVIVISDSVKPGAAEALCRLKQNGVRRCVMLTGDHASAAGAAAAELPVDDVRAELLPQDKVAAVEELLKTRSSKETLGFVGDGINDAPVLACADVGFAMGTLGSDAAIEAADVVIMDDDLNKMNAAVRIARKTLRIAKENIAFALGVKAAVLLLGALGIASLWLAVFADVGVMMLAVLNAMRTLRTK